VRCRNPNIVRLLLLLVAGPLGHGQDVELENSTARTKELAQQGDRKALTDLARAYDNAGNFGAAFDIRLRFAEEGDAACQYSVGSALINGQQAFLNGGRSVPKNSRRGYEWVHRAAVQGHPQAMYQLGRGYLDGNVLKGDSAEAYKWLLLAKKHGHNDSTLLNDTSLKLPTEVAKEGQRRANQFLATNSTGQSATGSTSAQDSSFLRLYALAGSTAEPVAMINGERFTEGTSLALNSKGSTVEVKCLRIERNGAVVCLPPSTNEIHLSIVPAEPKPKKR
jgi:TPR repeat protein